MEISLKHKHHHEMMIKDFRKRFWICLILTVPVLILSPMIQHIFGYSFKFYKSDYLIFILSTIIFFYGGYPFFKGLYKELKQNIPGMMTLVGLAITVAYIYSILVLFLFKGELFFWELATLIDVMLLGHWIEMRSILGASKALEKLAQLLPSTANVIQPDGSIKEVSIYDTKKGNKILIKPGEKIPADGIVISGESHVNEAALTGESKPVYKTTKSKVIAGSINEFGSLTVEVEKDLKENYISQVIDLISKVMESKSKTQNLADKAAFYLTILAIASGLITLFAWLFIGQDLPFSLEKMVTVMVITCPHALGLAIPLVVAAITSQAAKKGLLIRNRTDFEQAKDINIVVFDKTGTLTTGIFEITDIIPLSSKNEDEILTIAASIEQHAKHSIAYAIEKKAKEKKIKLKEVNKPQTIPGKGIIAFIEQEKYLIGSIKLLKDFGFKNENELSKITQKVKLLTEEGKTTVLVATENQILGIIAASDTIRKESYTACQKLKKLDIQIAMITGDNKETAKKVGKKLGLNKILAEVLPHEKASEIEKLKKEGLTVAMVGDGINDAPALVASDIGIAIGAGSDIAIESADIILVTNDPEKVVDIIRLSKITRKKIIQNLIWATGYNILSMPLAAGVLYNYGITIEPAIGALFMSLSTIIVAFNAALISYKT